MCVPLIFAKLIFEPIFQSFGTPRNFSMLLRLTLNEIMRCKPGSLLIIAPDCRSMSRMPLAQKKILCGVVLGQLRVQHYVDFPLCFSVIRSYIVGFWVGNANIYITTHEVQVHDNPHIMLKSNNIWDPKTIFFSPVFSIWRATNITYRAPEIFSQGLSKRNEVLLEPST